MSSTSIILNTITQTNSTSYCDELGVLIGLSRLPGETSESYMKRLKTATRVSTGQDYVGLLNELTLQLGLNIGQSIALVPSIDTGSNVVSVASNLAGLVLIQGVNTQTVPLVTVDIDDAWTWFMLSDVVAAINAGTIATATLLVDDAPTMTLASQSNTLTVLAQPISGQNISLGYTGVITGSEVFNNSVPPYTINTDGTIVFSQPIAAGTTITYQYQLWPYNLIGGDVGLISLLDPALSTVAQGADGTMIYQVREVVQAIAAADQSYWAK